MRTISIATRTLARGERWLLVVFVLVVTAAVFLRSVGFDFIVDYDDTANLHAHESWRGLSAKHLGWMATASWQGHYHPLTWLTWAIDWTLWGLDPRGYHLQNVLWHVLNAGLVFALLRSLLSRFADASRAAATTGIAAAAGALFFAIHPLRAESVAWVTERRDVVSLAFLLLALLAYLRASDGRRTVWITLSVACAALSLLAKAWAITLPALLLMLDAWPLRRSLKDPRVWLEKLPFAVVCAFFAVMALRAQAESGALQPFAELSPLSRIGTALYGLAFYPWLTVVPIDLIPAYEMTGDDRVTFTRFVLGGVIVAAAVVTGVMLRKRAPAVPAALLAYAILVAPVSGIAQSGAQAAADRYSYIACLPFAALYAYAAWRWSAMRVVALLHLPVLAALAFLQVGMWRDATTLWTAAAERDSQNVRANLWLGETEYRSYEALSQRGQREPADAMLASARTHLRNAWLRNSKHPRVLQMRGRALYATGREEDVRDANRFWRRALALWPNDPDAGECRGRPEASRLRYPKLFDEPVKR